MNTSNFAMASWLPQLPSDAIGLCPMAENEKGLGSKFLGLFVEKEDGATEKSAADEIAELAKQSGAAPALAGKAAAAHAAKTTPDAATPPPGGPALKMPAT